MTENNSNNITSKEITLTEGGWYHDAKNDLLPSDADPNSVKWSSSDPEIASVNMTNGYIHANMAGTAKIYATAADGSASGDYLTVNVAASVQAESISLDRSTLTMNRGCICCLTATVLPANATNISIFWQSSNRYVAQVDASTGKVRACRCGEATITATTLDGSNLSATCEITVSQTVVCDAEETPRNRVKYRVLKKPVDTYNGSHVLKNNLISLFGGLGLSLVAHYDSSNLSMGNLGIGWYHNYEKFLRTNLDTVQIYSTPSVFSRYVKDGSTTGRYICTSPDKPGYVLTVDNSGEYRFVLDCNSNHTEYYDSCGRLAKIVNHEGFATTITYCDCLVTITDCITGKKIYLERDSLDRVVKVHDGTGRFATLQYDKCKLTAITDVNGLTIKYIYDSSNRIIEGIDAKNKTFFVNTYDKYGRLEMQYDSFFDTHKTIYSYNQNIRTVTNRLGKTSRHGYDNNGLLICHRDENGNLKTFEYDDACNLTKETDALGNSTLKEYNSFKKPTKITDKNGNITTLTYDNNGNVTQITYPAIDGRIPTEHFVYNSRNQILRHTDTRGTVTVYTYDENGMPATKKVGNRNAITYSYENGFLKSVTDARGYTTTYEYNDIGLVKTMTNADEKVTRYEYDCSGNLLKTTDANNKTIINQYDANYQKISVTDANGNKTRYSYNSNLKNDSITLPDNNVIRYEFDREDRVTKTFDQLNNLTETAYDDGGRVVSQLFADGGEITYEYDAAGRVTKETNQKDGVTQKTYDAMGNVLTVTDHDGNVTTYQYNALSKVSRAVNAALGTTVYEYSKAGDLLKETDPFGKTKIYTYDAYGNMLTAKDARGHVTTYTYDQNNNMLSMKDPIGNITEYTYDCLNRLVSVKDAKGNTVSYGYDALGRRTTITDARGNVFTTSYDGNGNVTKTVDAKGKTVSETVYNCLNLPYTVKDTMGKTTTYLYNELGKIDTVTDPLGNVSEYGYDVMGRNTSVKDAHNKTSSAVYDKLGNVTLLRGPLGAATSYAFDEMGKLENETTPSGGTKSYTYNALNLKETFTNARGQTRSFTYDAKGRITGYTCPEGAVSYTYDENDNILSVTDSHGTITRTYDKLNRVLSYTDTYGRTIGYAYDSVGNLVRITYPDNTFVSYEYDANHNLVKVIDWNGRWVVYTYDENNHVTSKINPDLSYTGIVYDDMQRVTSNVDYDRNGDVICGFEYIYDDLSRIVEEKILDKNVKFCYTYDELSRVTKRETKSLDNTVISEESFTYDAAGNITNAPDSSFAYDTNNKLTVFCGDNVTYDLDGNMLSCGSLSFTYDSANRLIATTGNVYTYNAEDVRIKDLYLNGETTYTYNTNCKLSQLLWKTEGGVTTKYVYGLGLLYEETANNIKIYHFDNRGSTVALTNASGNITDTYAYDTYGKQISHVGTSNIIFGYNGRDGVITESNGLIYMRARYYSPDMKRFVNADIVRGAITNAVTLNRYAYANANPITNVDPLGLSAKDLKPIKETSVMMFDEGGGGSNTVSSRPANFDSSTIREGASAPNSSSSATDFIQDAFNDFIDSASDAFETAKEIVVDAYGDTQEWVEEKIIEPATEFIDDIGEDIQAFDKNNTDEQKVLNSHYFSSYMGKLVIRTDMDRSGSFGVLFITHETNNRTNPEDVIRHEYGHTKQLDQLGIVNYALFIGLPSWQEWSSDSYYDRPWEVTADTYGVVQSRTPSQAKIDAGEDYLDIIKSDIPIWEKIAQLSQYYN